MNRAIYLVCLCLIVLFLPCSCSNNVTEGVISRDAISDERPPEQTDNIRATDMTSEERTSRQTNDIRATDMASEDKTSQQTDNIRATDMTGEERTSQQANEIRATDMTSEDKTSQQANDIRATDMTSEGTTSRRTNDFSVSGKIGEERSSRQTNSNSVSGKIGEERTSQQINDISVTNSISSKKTSIAYMGEWELYVRGNPVVGSGSGDFTDTFMFSDEKTGDRFDSILLARVSPVTDTTRLFYQDWGATTLAMTEYVQKFEEKGTTVIIAEHDQARYADDDVYVFYFELSNGDYSIPITIAWRFDQSYYVTLMGINWGDMPEISDITTEAAMDFRDYTEKPLSGLEHITIERYFEPDIPEWIYEWNYSIINPFLAIGTYLYDEGGFYNPVEPEKPIVQDISYDWGDQTPKPVDEVIPSIETFLERYNEAAEELGAPIIIRDDLEEWEFGNVNDDYGYIYTFRNNRGNLVCTLRFCPLFVWLDLPGESERERLLIYAATAAAVTGLPAGECLTAMTDLVLNAEFDVAWNDFNGYEAYVNSAVLNGAPFSYENGRFPASPGTATHAKMLVNPDGQRLNSELRSNRSLSEY
ncbi:MAG: hypothetical protein FWH55_11625 [Oscillospiraceae bacterium]|nr:hypothetical protein [Oscillospiraceae bacterium]